MWNYDLVVDGDDNANPSLRIAEICGTATHLRKRMTGEQFAPIVAIFEPHRAAVEATLCRYNEENYGSWRDFAGLFLDFIPSRLYEQGAELLK